MAVKFPTWIKTSEDYERWKRGEGPGPDVQTAVNSNSLRFQNPANGYIVSTKHPGCYTFLFGCLYFAYHSAWSWAFISFFAALFTAGISWLIFPFFGKNVIRKAYLQKGWIEL